MGELFDPYPRLPKNIRQIGERDQVVRLYMEDYVNTYLRRLYPMGGQDLRVGLLLGNVEMHEGTPYIFVDGAIEMEGITAEGEKVDFTEAAWKKVYEEIEEMFPKRTVQGWFLCGAQGCQLSPLNYWKQHGQYFQGKYKLMYLNLGLEGEEAVYITSEDGFYRLQGYCVYYERNQMMQDYMILRKDAHRVESGGNESVIRDFRQRMEERKTEITGHRSTIGMLGGLCSILSVMVLAGGIVMFNNYHKMKEMEAVVASVFPEGTGILPIEGNKTGEKKGTNTGDVIVEEASGGVYPTEDSAGETAGKDKTLIITQETLAPSGGNGQAAGGGAGSTGASPEALGNGGGNGTKDVADSSGGQSGTGEASPDKTSAGQAGQGQTVSGQAGAGQAGSGQTGAGQTDPGRSGTSAVSGGAQISSEERKDSGYGQSSGKAESGQPASAGGSWTYTVQDGETLYGICIKFYHNLSKIDEICRLNGLDDEDKIISGQKLILP